MNSKPNFLIMPDDDLLMYLRRGGSDYLDEAMSELEHRRQSYEGPVHYFASCAFGWAVAETRHEAHKKLARAYFDGKAVRHLQKRGNPGAYIWSCKVMADQSEDYNIEFYAPTDVVTDGGQSWYVTYMTNAGGYAEWREGK